MKQPQFSIRVWDLPTRLFHWGLALLVGTSWITGQLAWLQIHFVSGYCILALLLFRLVWGLIGSDTARFSRFLRGPGAALRHLAHITRREPDLEIGHNPAGGWMVIIMLLVVAAQVATGLFSNDDIFTEGPLAKFVSRLVSGVITTLHHLGGTLILLVAGLHILAIIVYAVVKRQNLWRPMITGRKRLPGTMRPPRMASPLLAAAVFGAAAVLVALFVNLV